MRELVNQPPYFHKTPLFNRGKPYRMILIGRVQNLLKHFQCVSTQPVPNHSHIPQIPTLNLPCCPIYQPNKDPPTGPSSHIVPMIISVRSTLNLPYITPSRTLIYRTFYVKTLNPVHNRPQPTLNLPYNDPNLQTMPEDPKPMHISYYYTIPYHTIPYHTIPYHTIPYHTIPYHTIPYHTIPYHTIPYHTIPYHTIPYHTIPYHTIPQYFPYSSLPVSGKPSCPKITSYYILEWPIIQAKEPMIKCHWLSR